MAQVQPIPTSIVISPGETIGLSAIAFDQEGCELKQVSINWQGREPRAGAITSSGVFRAGFTRGHFRDALVVTARAPAALGSSVVQATASVTVGEFSGQLQPAIIRVFPELKEVQPLETMDLIALAVDPNGVAIPNVKFRWEMLQASAGTISEGGKWTASEGLGSFPEAKKVSLASEDQDITGSLSTSLDVQIVDPVDLAQQVTATTLPQVISLKPAETIRFTTMVLNGVGNQIFPEGHRWETVDARAGIIYQNGNFIAGKAPGIYPDAVRVVMKLPGIEGEVIATGTVIVVDTTPPRSLAAKEQLPRVSIFPERVILSPGESTQVSVISPDGDIRELTDSNVSWSVVPPEVGEVSKFVTVTAHDSPGIYEDAIRAKVTLKGEMGLVVQEVSATLIIRGKLNNVAITPQVATMAPDERIQFRAVAYDRGGVLLPNVSFRWSITDPAVGDIDGSGLFIAEGRPGEYPGAVQVEATER